MTIPNKTVFYLLFFSGLILLFILIMQPIEILQFHQYIAVLFPKGLIGLEQRNLLFIIQAIMLLVIIPVYIFTFIFSWKYWVHNKKATYDPDLIDHTLAEYVWWGVPLVLTLVICVITWIKTFELDPYRPLVSDKKTLTVQAVALQWNWLFLYPEEGIASMNFLQIPIHTPVHFEITADAPMNSLWIPHLGGQIYAMPKMKTELHLIADELGDFRGSSANLSGVGFADMHFITRSSTEETYRDWVETGKKSNKVLNFEEYNKLALPRENHPVEVYQLEEENLFDRIIMKFMQPERK